MTRCRIRDSWQGAGTEGELLCTVFADQQWAVVLWDADDYGEPDLHKMRGLEIIGHD